MNPLSGLTLKRVSAIAATLVLGAAGGALFYWLKMPLAWLIGAMVATTAAALAGAPVVGPGWLRNLMITVLGIMLGSSFTPAAVAHVDRWVPSLAVLIVFIIIVVACVATFLVKARGFDLVTAFFSASPGGLATMVVYGAELGGDERRIGLVHSLRIMVTVLVIPFWFRFFKGYVPGSAVFSTMADVAWQDLGLLALCAFGYPVARLLRFPAPQMIGPMAASATIHMLGLTAAKPPFEIVSLAQVVIGTAIGCRFIGVHVTEVLSTITTAVGTTLFMLVLAILFALGLELATGLPFTALWLAFAPGGLAEMTLISLAMGIDTAFVSTHHLLRVVFMVFSAPLVFAVVRRVLMRGDREKAGDGW